MQQIDWQKLDFNKKKNLTSNLNVVHKNVNVKVFCFALNTSQFGCNAGGRGDTAQVDILQFFSQCLQQMILFYF